MLFLFIIVALYPLAVFATNCYWRDGSIATFDGNIYTPCTNSSVSTCCLLADGDTCTPPGLCKSSSGLLFRNACTDPTWTSPDCLPLCPNVVQYAQLTECNDGSYCCTGDASCCSLGQGLFIDANKTLSPDPSASTSSTSSPTSTSTQASTSGPNSSAWHFIIDNAWLATPIIAAIGWIQTWLISACLVKGDYGFVADRRYCGLAKRTVMASFLAKGDSLNPQEVIGCVTMDPGVSSQLDDLRGCRANIISYISWIVQLGATLYAIFIASFVWAEDSSVENTYIQFPLLLGVLNINRGTWAIAIIGCLLRRRVALLITTLIAVIIDILFIFRGFDMAWHINKIDTTEWVGILAWTLPAIETTILIAGIIAASFNAHYISPKWFIFIPAAFWLALGPWFIIAVSIGSHFAQQAFVRSS